MYMMDLQNEIWKEVKKLVSLERYLRVPLCRRIARVKGQYRCMALSVYSYAYEQRRRLELL